MKLTLGYSPCPNDTFIFDALANGKIDTEGLEFEIVLGDVEQLNQKAFKQELDITKLSYHAYAYLIEEYTLLTSGSALGRNCGPLLVAGKAIGKAEIDQAKIAIPGKYTTANFLLHLAFPRAQNRHEVLFSEIEEQVLSGGVDAGLIIHENRFTYHERGLVKLMDLGQFWEDRTGLPIPLGGIVVRRSLDRETQLKIDRVLRRSVNYALAQPAQTMDYVRQHAQAMEPEVMRQHIGLYVNDFTVDIGAEGRKAVQYLFDTAREHQVIPQSEKPLFVGGERMNGV